MTGTEDNSLVTASCTGIVLEMKTERGKGPARDAIFIGERAKIEITRFKVEPNPPELTADLPPSDPNGVPQHTRNWGDCREAVCLFREQLPQNGSETRERVRFCEEASSVDV